MDNIAAPEGVSFLPRDKGVPRGADFAVRITDKSMEPFIKAGEIVYVARARSLSIGDVGIFHVNGRMKCRQYVEDSEGNIYLLSCDRDDPDDDMLPPSAGAVLFGRVLLRERPPLPER